MDLRVYIVAVLECHFDVWMLREVIRHTYFWSDIPIHSPFRYEGYTATRIPKPNGVSGLFRSSFVVGGARWYKSGGSVTSSSTILLAEFSHVYEELQGFFALVFPGSQSICRGFALNIMTYIVGVLVLSPNAKPPLYLFNRLLIASILPNVI